jgi:glycerol-3-phosphate acyltransferase PlsY
VSITAILLTIFGFFLGALMFSYWLGKWALKRDIRELGDGNPGAFNLFKTGNIAAGIVGASLDIGKGVTPIGLAIYVFNLMGWELVPIALSPLIGHAFSPFMGFKGGKAVAATAGMWMAIQPVWSLVVGLPIFVGSYLALNTSGWAVVFSVVIMTVLQLVFNADPVIMAIWLLSGILLVYKYRADLRQPPALNDKLRSRLHV